MNRLYEKEYSVNSDILLDTLEKIRQEANRKLNPERKSSLGQFTTPQIIAVQMASMPSNHNENVSILDPGAGVGTLSSSLVHDLCMRPHPPMQISVSAYEIEPIFIPYLQQSYELCQRFCENLGIAFKYHIHELDFVGACSNLFQYEGTLFENPSLPKYSHAILNPPYHKINSQSLSRKQLSKIGIEISNLYAAFVWLSIKLLEANGELVAITPRSFCNGPYFKGFRRFLISETAFRKIHIFESRNKAFHQDDVLQENIIYHLVRGGKYSDIEITASLDPADEFITTNRVPHNQIIDLNDPNFVIHIPTTRRDSGVVDRINLFSSALDDLGVSVSTGRVVDFRAKRFIGNRRDTRQI